MPPIEVSPTIYIGLGGTGIRFIQAMKRQLFFQRSESSANQWMVPFTRLITIDTAPVDLNQELEDDEARRNARDERFINKVLTATKLETNFHATVADDIIRDVIQKESDRYSPYRNWYEWFDPRCLAGHVRIEHGAAQKRILGRFCFSANFFPIRKLLKDVINELKTAVGRGKDELCPTVDSETYRLGGTSEKKKIRFVVVAGLAGGTGSGFFLDVCYLLRHFQQHRKDVVASSAETSGDSLHLYGFLDTLYQQSDDTHESKERKACNCYGALQDLNYFNQSNGQTSENLDRRRLPTDPFRPFTERRSPNYEFRWNWGNDEGENEALNWIKTTEPIADRVFLIGKDDLHRNSAVSQYEAVEMAATHAIAIRTTPVAGAIKVDAVNADDARMDFAREFDIGLGDSTESPLVLSPRFRAFGVTRSRVAEREVQLSVAALRGDLVLTRWLGRDDIAPTAESLTIDGKWSEDVKSVVNGCTDPESLQLHFPAEIDLDAFDVEDSDSQAIALRGLTVELTSALDRSIAECTMGQHKAAWHEEVFGAQSADKDSRASCRLAKKSLASVLADLDATEQKITGAEGEIVDVAREFLRIAQTHRRQSMKLAKLKSAGFFERWIGGECIEDLERQLAGFMADLKRLTRQAIDLYAWYRCKSQRGLSVLPVLSGYRGAVATLKDALSRLGGERETLVGLTPLRTLFDKLVPAKRPHMWDQVTVAAGFSKEDDGYVGSYEQVAQAKISSCEKPIRIAALNSLASMDPEKTGSPMNTALQWQEASKLSPDKLAVIRDAIFESAFMLRGETDERRWSTGFAIVADPPKAVPQLPTHLPNGHPSLGKLEERVGRAAATVGKTKVQVAECLAIAMDQIDLSATLSLRKRHTGSKWSSFILFASSTKHLKQRPPLPVAFDPAATANIVCNTLLLMVAGGYNDLESLVKHQTLDSGLKGYTVAKTRTWSSTTYECFDSLGEIISRQHEDEALRTIFQVEAERVELQLKRWGTKETRNLCRAVLFNKDYFYHRGANAQISLDPKQAHKKVDTQTEHYYWLLLEQAVRHHGERLEVEDRRTKTHERSWEPLEQLAEWLPVESIPADASPDAWTSGLLSLSGKKELTQEEIRRNRDIWRHLSGFRTNLEPFPFDDHDGDSNKRMENYARNTG